jgi:flavin-dependent dehydrogenase
VGQGQSLGATAVERCDAIVVGGGPAGSTCAWRLRRAGLDVVIVDRARFPRDKVCAGWITPQVVATLELDLNEYGRHATLQPIRRFRVGRVGDSVSTETTYERVVSFGIRRCEFDHYLLTRSGARVVQGVGVTRIERVGDDWIVNNTLRAPVLVGAGGHFCPVARVIGARQTHGSRVVLAREIEVPDDGIVGADVDPSAPELYFCDDLRGYGWVFRKQGYLNIGLGRFGERGLAEATDRFVAWLLRIGRLRRSGGTDWRWRGHAYSVWGGARTPVPADGVLLVGDALGLAYAESGEGIRPAVESGVLAAETIREAAGCYTRARLSGYDERLSSRFRTGGWAQAIGSWLPTGVSASVGRRLLAAPWFVRRVVLDRWFLHAAESALGTR